MTRPTGIAELRILTSRPLLALIDYLVEEQIETELIEAMAKIATYTNWSRSSVTDIKAFATLLRMKYHHP